MKPSGTLVRVAAALCICWVALGAGVSPALASPAPAKASLSVSVPIAVRAGAAFSIRGSVTPTASSGETITVTMERLGSDWSVVSTSSVMVGSHREFSARVSADKRGHWRVRIDLPATASHTSARETYAFKAVGSKVIALTFDDGPWPSSTAGVISALSKNDAEATFFVLGSQVHSRAALLRSEAAHGNAIGVHSWNHALMTRRSSATNLADLKRCLKAVRAATGLGVRWFRPPYGSTNSGLKKTAASLGLHSVLWNVDTLDWKIRTKSSVVSRALAGAKDGRVILMHDGGGPRSATVTAVPTIVTKLRAKGFDFVTLDEMAALGYHIP